MLKWGMIALLVAICSLFVPATKAQDNSLPILVAPETYSACNATSDVIHVTNVGNRRLKGQVIVQYVIGNERQTVQGGFYPIDKLGDLHLTVQYPPISEWPFADPPANTVKEIHVDIQIEVYDGAVLVTTLGPGSGWDVFCKDTLPPPPTGVWSTRVTGNCTTGKYEIQVFPPSEENRFEVFGPLVGELKPYTYQVEIFIKPDGGAEFSMLVWIPAVSTVCDGEEESHESTYPCLAPLGENLYAARWILPDHSMVGSWQFFYGKELTLTFENSNPSDVFEFYVYPLGWTLDDARKTDPSVAGQYAGTSTVNTWVAGLEPRSCTPYVFVQDQSADEDAGCVDCPPEVCELFSADDRVLLIPTGWGWLTISIDKLPNTLSVATNSTGTYYLAYSVNKPNITGPGVHEFERQCTTCSPEWAYRVVNGTIEYYYGLGSTISGLTVRIQAVEHMSYEAAHAKAVRISNAFDRRANMLNMFGWFSG